MKMLLKKCLSPLLLGLCVLPIAGAAQGQITLQPGVGNALTERLSGLPADIPGDQVYYLSQGEGPLQQAYRDYLQNRFQKAAPELETFLQKVPQSVPAHLLLADIYLRQNQLPKAIPQLETVTYLHPEDAATQNQLGAAYLQSQQYDKAVRLYQIAHARHPKDSQPVFSLGVALNREGKLAQAADAFAQAGSLARKDSRAFLLAGLLYHQTGNDAAAVPALHKALDFGATQKFDIYTALAEAATAAGNPDEALRNYTLALQLMPNDFPTVANLGVLNQNLGKIADAAAFYRQALKLNTGDPQSRAAVQANLESLSQP